MDIYKEIEYIFLNNEINIIKEKNNKLELLYDKTMSYINLNEKVYIIYHIDYGYSDDTIISSKNMIYNYFNIKIDFNVLTFEDIIKINLKIKEEIFKSNDLLKFFILQIFIKSSITYIVRMNRFNILPEKNVSNINNINDIINIEKDNLNKDINNFVFNNFRNLIVTFYQKIIRLNSDDNTTHNKNYIYEFINKIKIMKNISNFDYENIEIENKCLILLCQAFCNFNINAIIIIKYLYEKKGIEYIIDQIPLEKNKECKNQIENSIKNIIKICSAKIMMNEHLMK